MYIWSESQEMMCFVIHVLYKAWPASPDPLVRSEISSIQIMSTWHVNKMHVWKWTSAEMGRTMYEKGSTGQWLVVYCPWCPLSWLSLNCHSFDYIFSSSLLFSGNLLLHVYGCSCVQTVNKGNTLFCLTMQTHWWPSASCWYFMSLNIWYVKNSVFFIKQGHSSHFLYNK